MVSYKPLIKRPRHHCLIYFYFVIVLALMWITYAAYALRLKTSDPPNPKYIYFVETSEPNGTLQLTPRQACAVESAAKANSDAIIQLYVTGIRKLESWQEKDDLWSILFALPNFELKFINLTEHLAATPLMKIIESNRLETNPLWITWHKSDLLRYVLLWKQAGTYLDLDVISMRSVKHLGSNWVAYQNKAEIGASNMRFSLDDVGRNIINNIVEDLAQSYNGSDWADSSVGVLTRAALKQCNGTLPADSINECDGLKFWPAETFYAIPYEKRDLFFDTDQDQYKKAMQMVDQSIGSHLWNFKTQDRKVDKYKQVLINELAKRYCPNVYDRVELNI